MGSLLWSYNAKAQKDPITLNKDLKVYSEMSSDMPVLVTLKAGQKARFFNVEDSSEWKKIILKTKQGRKEGFVSVKDLRAQFARRGSRKLKRFVFRDRIGLGVSVFVSRTEQGARSYSSGDGSPIEISLLSGTGPYYGFFATLPISKQFLFQLGLNFRQISMTGKAGITGQAQQTVALTQKFMSLQGMLKFYPLDEWEVWVGVLGESAKATQVKLTYANDTDVPLGSVTLPTFFIVQGALGYDLHVWDQVYLIADVRYGTASNATPPISILEFGGHFAYQF